MFYLEPFQNGNPCALSFLNLSITFEQKGTFFHFGSDSEPCQSVHSCTHSFSPLFSSVYLGQVAVKPFDQLTACLLPRVQISLKHAVHLSHPTICSLLSFLYLFLSPLTLSSSPSWLYPAHYTIHKACDFG